MRSAGHAVNRVIDRTPGSAVDDLAGLDLDRARARVRAEGGDGELFETALQRALRAAGQPDRDLALTIAACAAWRAGVVDIRRDALRRAQSAPVPVVACALLLEGSDLATFLAAQAQDPFGWIAPLRPWVATVGGFRGLGGPWLEPPTAFGAFSAPGEFWVRADGQLQLLRADVFGHRWLPGPLEQPPAQPSRLEHADEHSYMLGIRA